LSVCSWYLIVTKAVQGWLARRRADAFLNRFWEAESIEAATAGIDLARCDSAFERLAAEASGAARRGRLGNRKLATVGGLEEYLTRILRKGIDQETARSEHGLTLLASAGSAAPYIGLFGTVWGIYHALVAIGLSGQGTLDRVAGPVGEALIMTALGLAVAIPAVLAFNHFTRSNRVWLATLEAYAHDLITLLTVETPEDAEAGCERRPLRVAVSG
ncbi:MAG TPA: MotA/TolQ/ExbB proton channel family protein, partial [Opitutaceae bacterium]|nr:MotA/TolQ/ExbB proton channel family protein [Opitutaceae bacterium]